MRPGVRRSVDREYFRLEHLEPTPLLADRRAGVGAAQPARARGPRQRALRTDGESWARSSAASRRSCPAGVGAYRVVADRRPRRARQSGACRRMPTERRRPHAGDAAHRPRRARAQLPRCSASARRPPNARPSSRPMPTGSASSASCAGCCAKVAAASSSRRWPKRGSCARWRPKPRSAYSKARSTGTVDALVETRCAARAELARAGRALARQGARAAAPRHRHEPARPERRRRGCARRAHRSCSTTSRSTSS